MVRYNRMKGRPTLWLPGTDHAGIATQVFHFHDPKLNLFLLLIHYAYHFSFDIWYCTLQGFYLYIMVLHRLLL